MRRREEATQRIVRRLRRGRERRDTENHRADKRREPLPWGHSAETFPQTRETTNGQDHRAGSTYNYTAWKGAALVHMHDS